MKKWSLLVFLGIICVASVFMSGAMSSITEHLNPKLQDAISTVNAVKQYVTESSDSSGGSVRIRRELMLRGWKAFIKTYGLGLGGGGDKSIQEEAGSDVVSMHNYWFELLINGGFLLFVVFFAWYIFLALELFFLSRRFPARTAENYYCASLSLSLIGFIPGAITASSAVYILPQYILYGFGIAMVNVGRLHKSAQNRMNSNSKHLEPIPELRQS